VIPFESLAEVGLNQETFGGLLFFLCCFIAFKSIATLLHELGHALPALLLTNSPVSIRVGDDSVKPLIDAGRMTLSLSLRNASIGFTSYDRNSLSVSRLVLIVLGGPVVSLSACVLSTWFIVHGTQSLWISLLAAAFLSANGLVFLRSIIPVKLRPTNEFPEGPPSDGLDLIRILCNERN